MLFGAPETPILLSVGSHHVAKAQGCELQILFGFLRIHIPNSYCPLKEMYLVLTLRLQMLERTVFV